jgi:hypothetical protein
MRSGKTIHPPIRIAYSPMSFISQANVCTHVLRA